MTNWAKIESTLVDLLVEVRLANRGQTQSKESVSLRELATKTDPSLTGDQLWQRERRVLLKRGELFRTAQAVNGKLVFSLGDTGSRYGEYTLLIRLPGAVLKSVSETIGYNLKIRSGTFRQAVMNRVASVKHGDTVNVGGVNYKVIKA